MEQICVNAPEAWLTVATGLVTLMSFAANFISKDNVFGKVIHFLALNLKAPKK